MRRAGGLVLVAALALAGCQSAPTPEPVTMTAAPAPEIVVLDAAIADLDRTRALLLASPRAVVGAALALDAADEACASGSGTAARTARDATVGTLAAGQQALADTPALAAAYRSALTGLARAAAPLAPEQSRALAGAVAAGGQEAAAAEAFAVAAGEGWPVYLALDAAQATWLTRVEAGWYRSESEAAGAYAVLVGPQRQALAESRTALGTADAARVQAGEDQRAALAAADAALAGLR